MNDEVNALIQRTNPRIEAAYYQIYDAARRGLCRKDIAKVVGICENTLKSWIEQCDELRLMLESVSKDPVILVEDALLKNAMGYTEIEETLEMENINGEFVSTKAKTSKKSVRGETNAQKFYLRNRNPDKWKDRPEEDGDGEVTVVFDSRLKDV